MDVDECTEILEDLLKGPRPRIPIHWSPRALLLVDPEEEGDTGFDDEETIVSSPS